MNDDYNALTEKANAAFRRSARRVVAVAKQTGTMIVVWREGRIQHLPPEVIERELDELDAKPD